MTMIRPFRSSRCAVPFTAAFRVIHAAGILRGILGMYRITGR